MGCDCVHVIHLRPHASREASGGELSKPELVVLLIRVWKPNATEMNPPPPPPARSSLGLMIPPCCFGWDWNAVSKVPSQTRLFLPGSLISAAYLPHGLFLTPLKCTSFTPLAAPAPPPTADLSLGAIAVCQIKMFLFF
ncbi:hypothetical protein M9H77_25937 [Catharanthus roseus]|uniref:Uncharacterized protein n=1 Tax=Catharanthus roseus TaxID=4058 RepID=A0ACC0A8I9_CATRO|nr:hypothetical protein M9H77_25937 [Catharanthus roseus]